MKHIDDPTQQHEIVPAPHEVKPLTTNPTEVSTNGVLLDQRTVESKWGIEQASVVAQFNLGEKEGGVPAGVLYLLSDGEDGLGVGADIDGKLEMLPLETGQVLMIGRNPLTTSGIKLREAFADSRISRNHIDVIRDEQGKVYVKASKDDINRSTILAPSSLQNIEKVNGIGAREKHVQNIEFKIGIAQQALKGEDYPLVAPDLGLFGAFDGVGDPSIGGGDVASETAANAIRFDVSTNTEEITSVDQLSTELVEAMGLADDRVTQESKAGLTTATVARIAELEGVKYVSWASIGDSRIYHYNATDHTIAQISQDEGYGKVITNALGEGNGTSVVQQQGVFKIADGDRLMLCTDGITGDKEPELIDTQTIGRVLRDVPDPKQAADHLLKISTKNDDKTCVVIGI